MFSVFQVSAGDSCTWLLSLLSSFHCHRTQVAIFPASAKVSLKPPACPTASLPPCHPPCARPSKANVTCFVFLLSTTSLHLLHTVFPSITNHPKSLNLKTILSYYFSQFCSSAERLLCWGNQGPLMWLQLNYKGNWLMCPRSPQLTCLAVGGDEWLGCLGFLHMTSHPPWARFAFLYGGCRAVFPESYPEVQGWSRLCLCHACHCPTGQCKSQSQVRVNTREEHKRAWVSWSTTL